MAENISTKKKINQISLFEINNGILRVYKLFINEDYRFRRFVPDINSGVPYMYYAQLIQGGWDKKPFEDLLDKNNKDAKTEINRVKLREMRSTSVNGIYSSFRLYHRWNEEGYNLSNIAKFEIKNEGFKEYERIGLKGILNGNNKFQPIRITKNEKDIYDGGCTILLPTHEYVHVESKKSKKTVSIMPAIAKIPTNIYLSHLIDIGDYDRFLHDEFVNDQDRINSFNNYIVRVSDITLSSLPQQAQEKVKIKAKNDEPIVNLLKQK